MSLEELKAALEERDRFVRTYGAETGHPVITVDIKEGFLIIPILGGELVLYGFTGHGSGEWFLTNPAD